MVFFLLWDAYPGTEWENPAEKTTLTDDNCSKRNTCEPRLINSCSNPEVSLTKPQGPVLQVAQHDGGMWISGVGEWGPGEGGTLLETQALRHHSLLEQQKSRSMCEITNHAIWKHSRTSIWR